MIKITRIKGVDFKTIVSKDPCKQDTYQVTISTFAEGSWNGVPSGINIVEKEKSLYITKSVITDRVLDTIREFEEISKRFTINVLQDQDFVEELSRNEKFLKKSLVFIGFK